MATRGLKAHDDAVPPVFEAPSGNPRFPLFDGLREAAAIGMVLGHSASLSGIAATTAVGRAIGDAETLTARGSQQRGPSNSSSRGLQPRKRDLPQAGPRPAP